MADDKQKHTDSHAKAAEDGKHIASEPQKHSDIRAKIMSEINQLRAAPQKQHEAPKPDAEQKFSELNDKYLRMCAEFDNYKKRTAKEKDALCVQSEAKLMLGMIPIYEEIGLAEKEVAKIKDESVRSGTLMVLSKLRASFEKQGLQPMKLMGEKFDPYKHEVALREDCDSPEGQIVRVISQGYNFRGLPLKHAIVSVSSGKKDDKANGNSGTEEKKE